MFVHHDDISAGKRCVVCSIVADGADASTSHALVVIYRYIVGTYHLKKTNTFLSPAREDGFVLVVAKQWPACCI